MNSQICRVSKAQPERMKKRPRASTDFYAKVHHKLFEMFENSLLVDVTICAGKQRVQAHRIVLAAASPFFHAMFSSTMMESKIEEISLPMIDESVLETIISFMYTGRLQITGDNVLGLLASSNLLEMVDVVNQCCCFLLSALRSSNCIQILEAVEQLGTREECAKLCTAAKAYANNFFSDVCETEDFLRVASIATIEELLTSDSICVTSEDVVMSAVMSWIRYNEGERGKYRAQLLKKVRFPLLSPQMLEHASSLPSQHFNMNNSKPRKPGIPTIYAIGGFDGVQVSPSVEYYDMLSNCWHQAPPMQQNRSYLGCAGINGKLYAAGGYNSNGHLSSFECYDPKEKGWKLLEPMKATRSYHGLVHLDGYIYAVGGFDGTSHLNSVERYDLVKCEWELVCPMNEKRSGLGVVVLENCIYAVGGFNGQNHLRSVEKYEPKKDCWVAIAEMKDVRNGPGVAVINGNILTLGGEYEHGKRVKTGELYIPSKNEWKNFGDELLECTSGHGIAVLDNFYIYSIGGSNQNNNYLRSVRRFDFLSKEWYTVGPMQEVRCGICVVVFDQHPNIQDGILNSS